MFVKLLSYNYFVAVIWIRRRFRKQPVAFPLITLVLLHCMSVKLDLHEGHEVQRHVL